MFDMMVNERPKTDQSNPNHTNNQQIIHQHHLSSSTTTQRTFHAPNVHSRSLPYTSQMVDRVHPSRQPRGSGFSWTDPFRNGFGLTATTLFFLFLSVFILFQSLPSTEATHFQYGTYGMFIIHTRHRLSNNNNPQQKAVAATIWLWQSTLYNMSLQCFTQSQ
jgi:hypothetical protein